MSSLLSKEELESSHKKALKALEGERRAAIKKAKTLKGIKAKEALAALEAEYDNKAKQLEAAYQVQLTSDAVEALVLEDGGPAANIASPATATTIFNEGPSASATPESNDPEEDARKRKLEKARKKKERQKEKEREMEEQIAWETANAGPSARQIELEQIQTILSPQKLEVVEVEADGHCLYRAVGAQIGATYTQIRKLESFFPLTAFYQMVQRDMVTEKSVCCISRSTQDHCVQTR